MDKLNLTYSLKNIPIPSRFQYQKQLVSKVESFARRMRWKMFHILNPGHKEDIDNHGFKSTRNPPQLKELKAFEDELFDLVANIKYKKKENQFLHQLKNDKDTIKKTDKVIVQADKSPNLYKMEPEEYKKLVLQNITKDYRKCSRSEVEKVTKEAARIARRYNLDDRIDIPTENEAFISIKDHKKAFPGRIECRLINPAKNHIGVLSKKILDKWNIKLRNLTGTNQWKNTKEVIKWFNNIKSKSEMKFFKFDIVNYYPSISEKLLSDTIKWAATHININSEEIEVVKHCRKNFLYYDNNCWVKQQNQDFDVSMGSLDSAEICETVGLFLLAEMNEYIPKQQMGLYRDDGLAVIKLSGPETERLRKNITKLFNNHNLKITTEINIETTDFLDVYFNLKTDEYKPYRKENNTPIYINKQSNHPPHIKKELPKMISTRISELSKDKQIFLNEAPTYNLALKNAGYNSELKYMKNEHKTKTRKRNILWFNPPWNDDVVTNIARKFLNMIEKHFPKNSEFHKYFNKNNIKVSYSTMPNMAAIIASHNKMLTRPINQTMETECNCRKPKECALRGKCLTENIVYKCKVQTTNSTKEYIGITASSFKTRYTAHKASFTHEDKAHNTALSTYIWNLKNRNTEYKTNWSILKQTPSYSRNVRQCQLCLTEKTYISIAEKKDTLNKRNEIISKCRHRDKLLLKHW